jgi:nucleotide-binding universal stress UspA family protein
MAKKIKNILVTLDGSKNSFRGLDEAIFLARECHATITAVFASHLPTINTLHSLGFLSRNFKKEAKKIFDTAKTRAAKKGILLKHKIIDGYDPGYEIVRYSNRNKPKFDIIVVGARGKGIAKELFFGSVSNYIVHKASMPVLVVK